MKTGVIPQLSSAWWAREKDLTVPKEPLFAALAAFEKRKKTALASQSVHDWTKLKDDAEAVKEAARATSAKCNKVLHKATIAAMAKYEDLAEKEALTAQQMATTAKMVETQKSRLVELKKMIETYAKHKAPAAELKNKAESLRKSLPATISEAAKSDNGELMKRAISEVGKVRQMLKPIAALDNKLNADLTAIRIYTKPQPKTFKAFDELKDDIQKQSKAALDLINGLTEAKVAGSGLVEWFDHELESMEK